MNVNTKKKPEMLIETSLTLTDSKFGNINTNKAESRLSQQLAQVSERKAKIDEDHIKRKIFMLNRHGYLN